MRNKALVAIVSAVLLALLIVAVPLVASCKKAAPPTPTPTATARPTPTPTAPGPTPTPTPTPTRVPATPTATLVPGVTPSPTPTKPKEYVIGWQSPLTGPAGFWGEGMRSATLMAVEEINAAGGVDGVPLRVIFEDNVGQARPGVEAATKLIEVDRVPVMMITASAAIPAVLPITEEKKVVVLNHGAYLFRSEYGGKKYFIGIQAIREQMDDGMMEVAESLKLDNLAIIYTNTAMAIGMANDTRDRWKAKGHKVALFEATEMDQKDFRSLIAKVKTANPEAVVYIPYSWSETALILGQMKEMGYKVPFISFPGAYSDQLIKQAGDAAEGLIFVLGGFNPFDLENKKMVEVAAKFKAKFGVDMSSYSDWAALTYDAVYMLADAIKRGGYTADGINKALRQIKDFDGVTGKMTIDPVTGIAAKTLGKAWIKDGKATLWKGERPLARIPGPKPKEYVVGRLVGLTGTAGFWGEGIRDATIMAVEEINAAGGIDGVPLRVIYEDTAWQAKPGIDFATKLIEVDKVPAILVGGSAVIPAVKPITEAKKVVLINDAAYLEETEYQGNKYFVGIQVTRQQMDASVIEILEQLGVDKIAIEYGNTAQTVGMANNEKRIWTGKGHKVVAFESHELDQKDFRSLIAKLKASNPDVLIHIPYTWTEAALFFAQANELGWRPQVVSTTNIFNPQLIKQVGDWVEGTIITLGGFNMFDETNLKLQEVEKKFKARTGHSLAEFSDWAGLAYDATYMLADAIRRGGYTADGINQALRAIKDFDGTTGKKMSFDPTLGLVQKALGKAWVKDGKWTLWKGEKPAR